MEKKAPEIKRDPDGRPTTVIVKYPPYVGFVDGKYLEGVKSEKVTEITDGIKRDVKAMHKALEHGQFQNGRTGVAIAHAQVNTRPWAFFCVAARNDEKGQWDAFTVFNPEILETAGRGHRQKAELCLSFPSREKARVVRAEKVKVRYQTLVFTTGQKDGDPVRTLQDGKLVDGVPELSEPVEEWLEGLPAQIFQHETEHIMGGHIYASPVL